MLRKQKFYNFTGLGPFVLLDNLMRTIATSKLEQPFNQIEIGKYIPYIVIFFSIDNYFFKKKKENYKYTS